MWQLGPARLRLAVFVAAGATASATIYQSSLRQIAQVIAHPMRVVDERMVHSWGVLALCLVALAVKRRAIGARLASGSGPGWLALGGVCIAGSLVLPAPAALFTGLLGCFVALFGAAALWPAALLGLYLVAIGVPIVAETWLDRPIGLATIIPTEAALQALGYGVARNAQFLAMPDASGNVIRVMITAACAGPATFGVFIALFGLMAMDVRPTWPALAGLFLLGFLGTWLQNLIRVVYLLTLGYREGADAMWVAHDNTGYLWFIGWYVVFAFVYLTVAAHQSTRAATHAAV